MKMIIYINSNVDIVRIGLYDNNGKLVKWVSKKSYKSYIDKVDLIEPKLIWERGYINE